MQKCLKFYLLDALISTNIYVCVCVCIYIYIYIYVYCGGGRHLHIQCYGGIFFFFFFGGGNCPNVMNASGPDSKSTSQTLPGRVGSEIRNPKIANKNTSDTKARNPNWSQSQLPSFTPPRQAPAPTFSQSAATMASARTVKDVSPHEFVKAYSAHLKRSGKVYHNSYIVSLALCLFPENLKELKV